MVVGGLGVVVVFLDTNATIAVPGFWTILLILLFIAMGAMGFLTLPMAKMPPSSDPPNPPRGCLPGWSWIILWVLSLVYLGAGIVWLLGDSDGPGGWWTLGPIALALIVAGIGLWFWTGGTRSAENPGGTTPSRTLIVLSILVIGIVGIIFWFTSGRADQGETEAATDDGAVTTDAIVVPDTEPIQPAPVESAVEVTVPIAEADPEPEEVEETTSSSAAPQGTPLPEDVAILLGRWCAASLTPPSGMPTVESVFTEPMDVLTRPADSTDPPLASNPPGAIDLMNLGATEAGCGGDSKLMVIAYLGGPPSQVQLSVALDVSDDPGNVADPDSSELIPQVGGWDEFVAYDSVNGLFQSDANFVPIDSTAEADMEGNAFAFILDDPVAAEMIGITFQTFFRDGNLASSPTAWQGASILVPT